MSRHDDFQSVKISKQWKNQKGITGIGIAIILGLLAFFVLVALRLFPIYMEHFGVATHLENLGTETAMKGKSDEEILKRLKRSFQIDDIKNVKEEHIFIERENDGSTKVAVEYEVRTPMLGNIDVVVVFSDEVEIN